MARSFGVVVGGADELITQLKKNADLNDVKNAVKVNGSEMQSNAVRKAPVDTGFLSRNIELESQEDGFKASVRSEAEYAPYQEFGTRYQSGTPHIRPAYNEQKGKFKSDLERLMK